jgi:hypothetical protein
MRAAALIIIATGLLAQVGGSPRADVADFSDSTFEPDDWVEVEMIRPPPGGAGNGTGSGTATQVADGGNPSGGPYRELHLIRDPDMAGVDVSTRLFSFKKQATFTPCSMGAIDSLDLSVYGRQAGGGSGGTVEPALTQGDLLYVVRGESVPEQDWTLKSFPDLTQSSFIEPGLPASHPDFSANGKPIQFGFSYVVSTASEQTVERTVGFDDWQLTVHHTPPVSPVVINPGMNDAWYEPATAGQGFLIIVFPQSCTVFLSWFTYETERPPQDVMAILGEPGHRWLTAQGPFAGDTATLDVYLTSGGVFDSAQPMPETSAEPIGTIVIGWHDCETATLSYDLPGLGLQDEIELERLTPDNVALCEALQ